MRAPRERVSLTGREQVGHDHSLDGCCPRRASQHPCRRTSGAVFSPSLPHAWMSLPHVLEFPALRSRALVRGISAPSRPSFSSSSSCVSRACYSRRPVRIRPRSRIARGLERAERCSAPFVASMVTRPVAVSEEAEGPVLQNDSSPSRVRSLPY
jgi:hypothetical protein